MADHLQDGGRGRLSEAPLCRPGEVPEGGGRGFRLTQGDAQIAVFVLRWRGALYAYRNRCPHAGSPLDWTPDQFFDAPGEFLLCRTHGARFRPEDGLCVAGPCLGQRLEPAAIRIEGDRILVMLGQSLAG